MKSIALDKNTFFKFVEIFKRSNNNDEEVVKAVFNQHTGNTYEDILIKVIVLNQLYSAGLNANKLKNSEEKQKKKPFVDLRTMANYIEKNPINADETKTVREWISSAAKDFKIDYAIPYSFVTKYCAWSFPKLDIPIIDSYVRGMMYQINIQKPYHSFKRSDLEKTESENYYEDYCGIFDALAKKHFQNYSYKEIDMFLWQYGKENGIWI